MEVTFLGTGSAYPTPRRGASCIVMRNEGVLWMFDCGEGSQIQLMKSSLKAGKISKIFITHLHGDHVFGLPGLMCTISQNNTNPSRPIHIYGPLGLRRFLRESLGLSRSQLGFRYCVHELQPLPEQYPADWKTWAVTEDANELVHPNEDSGTTILPDPEHVWHLCDDEGMTVKAGVLKHRIPSFGFVIDEHSKPGKLDVKKLVEFGVPSGPLYGKIKSGKSITLDNGNVITPEDVMGPEKPGRRLAILGDSCDSDKMAALCQGVDMLVHEATLPNDMKDNALEKGHSTPEMAGEFARSVGAKHLVITHVSQRFRTSMCQSKEGDLNIQDILVEARAALLSDSLTVAEDFTTVSIPIKK